MMATKLHDLYECKIKNAAGDRFDRDTAPERVLDAIEARTTKGHSFGRVMVDGVRWTFWDLTFDGRPVLDSRAQSDEQADVLPEWMRPLTGC